MSRPELEYPTMPHSEPVNWQPISQIPLIASMIDGALDDTREHLATLIQAKTRPHVLDDATVDRSIRVHTEQMEFVDIYAQQITRWRTQRPSAAQRRELDRIEVQNQTLRIVTMEVLATARELSKVTIERVLAMSDLELGIEAIMETPPKR
jgi:hypothetical protein